MVEIIKPGRCVAVALGAMLLGAATGCGSATPLAGRPPTTAIGDQSASATPSLIEPGPLDSGPLDSGPLDSPPRGAGPLDAGRRWASSTQFMEIKSGALRDGVVHLELRPARKKVLGESFETEILPGPYFDAVMTTNARVIHLDGESGTVETFVIDLAQRSPNRPNHVTPDERQEGFDLRFDGQGHVTQVDWAYVPGR